MKLMPLVSAPLVLLFGDELCDRELEEVGHPAVLFDELRVLKGSFDRSPLSRIESKHVCPSLAGWANDIIIPREGRERWLFPQIVSLPPP
jgi:hypothetical protein